MNGRMHLHDERSDPPMRVVLGSLLSQATHADLAVAHVRLLALDLSSGEVARMRQCRMLLGRLDAAAFHGAPDAMLAADKLERLAAFVESGVAQVRSSGASAWTPDFSIFRGLPAGAPFEDGVACLIGAHYFVQPGVPGAALTCVMSGRALAERLSARFEEEWGKAHDVSVAVVGMIHALRQHATG
jgi:hypothetical protein